MAWAAVAAAAVGVVGGAIVSHHSGGGSSPSVSQQPNMTPEQQAALAQLLGVLTGRSSSTDPFTGQLTAPMTPGMGTSLTALEQQALRPDTSAADAYKSLLSDKNFDSEFTAGVEDPMIRDFQTKILPSITGRFGGNAAFGSDRQNAERNATSDLTTNLASARAGMQFQNRQLQAQAASGLEGVNKDRMQSLLSLFGAEAVPQQLQQQALTAQYQEFIRQQQGKDQNISQILAALGLQPLNTVVNPGQPGFLASAAPGIGSAFTQWALRNYFPQQTTTTTPPPSGGGVTSVDPNQGDTFGGP